MRKPLVVLSLETTGPTLGLALAHVDLKSGLIRPVATYFKSSQNKQSDILFPELTRLKKKVSGPLSLIVVDWGPGSFTGVRVGVAAARAMAQALDVPLVGVSCLDVWAHQSNTEGRVLVTHPALAGDVYFAIYEKQSGKERKEIISPTWSSEIEAEKKWKQAAPFIVADTHQPLHPLAVLKRGVDRYRSVRNKRQFSYEQCVPLYLQPSWAQRRKPC